MLILASRSNTRKTLLQQAGLAFTCVAADVDERGLESDAVARGADGHQVALLLAREKALAVSRLCPQALVIGADQTLALGDALLHKPSTLADAAAQLDRLRGNTHHLHAAVSLARNGETMWSDVQKAELTMRDFSAAERDRIIALESEDLLYSVGSYRLEGPSIQLFQSVSGDYFTILGLPLLPLLAALRDIAPDLFDERTPNS